MLAKETKAWRKAIEKVEPSGGWLKIRKPAALYPHAPARGDFFVRGRNFPAVTKQAGQNGHKLLPYNQTLNVT